LSIIASCFILLISSLGSMAQEGSGCVGQVSKKCHSATTNAQWGVIIYTSDAFVQECGSGLDALSCIDSGNADCVYSTTVDTGFGPGNPTYTTNSVPQQLPDPTQPCNIAKNVNGRNMPSDKTLANIASVRAERVLADVFSDCDAKVPFNYRFLGYRDFIWV
jgi:hypothetical protein